MIDERINKVAALANAAFYDSEAARKYIDGAPHIKHLALRRLYGKLVVSAYEYATTYNPNPCVLDLGAGEGSVTLPFLELGSKVTAIDISKGQLETLQAKCAAHSKNLEIRCEDVFEGIKSLQSESRRYDIVVANSFLHHIPDYLSLIRQASSVISSHGQFFSFQDPLRYSSVGRFNRTFTLLCYFSWRIFKGDIIGGVSRLIRRSRGVYLDNDPQDSAEYHAMRNGVDQDAIRELFEQMGFKCEIIPYFSTQSRIWQPAGTVLGINNTFGVLARRISRGT